MKYFIKLNEKNYIDCIDTTNIQDSLEVSKETFLRAVKGEINFYDNGEFIYKSEIIVLSFDELKSLKLSEIETGFKNAMSNLDKTPDEERLTFERQEREARVYLATQDESKAPFLKALALSRGVDLNVLAQKVVAKADLYANISATLIGKRQRYEDLVENATTKEELENIIVEFSI